jgi:hypothetical protein
MDVQIKCVCPGSPHEQDRVTLRDKLDFHTATTIRKALAMVDNDDPRTRTAEVLATLSEFYVLMGVQSWTLVDDKGRPLTVSQSAIRASLLESTDIDLVIEAADELYNEAILLPLLARASTSSPPTPTDESTSAPTDSEPKLPKPSKRSSTSTTQTVGTETTSLSLVGVSNSSQSSKSAA